MTGALGFQPGVLVLVEVTAQAVVSCRVARQGSPRTLVPVPDSRWQARKAGTDTVQASKCSPGRGNSLGGCASYNKNLERRPTPSGSKCIYYKTESRGSGPASAQAAFRAHRWLRWVLSTPYGHPRAGHEETGEPALFQQVYQQILQSQQQAVPAQGQRAVGPTVTGSLVQGPGVGKTSPRGSLCLCRSCFVRTWFLCLFLKCFL